MKDIYNSIVSILKGDSNNSIWSYIRIPLYIIIALAVLYGVVYLAAGREKPAHDDELLIKKLDSLQTVALQLRQAQIATLGNDITLYKTITKLQSQVDSIRGVKFVVNNYYGAKSNVVKTLQGKQLDSFYRDRYGY